MLYVTKKGLCFPMRMHAPRSTRRVLHSSPLEEVNLVSFTYAYMSRNVDSLLFFVLQLALQEADSLSRGAYPTCMTMKTPFLFSSPDSLLEKPLEVLILSSRGLLPLEVLFLPSRSPHL